MKSHLILLPLFLIALTTCQKEETEPEPEIVKIASPTTKKLTEIFFVNENVGYIGGEAELQSVNLYKTTDGGYNWSKVNINALSDITSIYFADINTGYITTRKDGHFRTKDGGQTWENIKDVTGDNTFFTSPANGYMCYCCSEMVRTTSDSGRTWNSYPFPTFGNSAVPEIDFPGGQARIGYAFSLFNNILYKTTDGGITWNPLPKATGSDIKDMYFYSENIGYIIGRDFTMKTTDGGNTFVVMNDKTGGYKIIAASENQIFIDASHLYSIIFSEDGGKSFTKKRYDKNDRHSGYTTDFCLLPSGKFIGVDMYGSVYKSK
jgi:photosystem II stability/assembly factor-like uncharacterized protein